MKLLVREVGPDEVEQDITQRDQFNTDTVGLAEALVREAHQNSNDARAEGSIDPVRTRVQIVEPRNEDEAFWRNLFSDLQPHLEACGINLDGMDLGRPRLLVIEDFGTTGLLGATDKKDDGGFSDFWRRNGRSHKRGKQAGRWGLGKLVFSSSSRIRTFFGLTIQRGDPQGTPYLMGQAVLQNHELSGPPKRQFAPHAFFASRGPSGIQVPCSDAAFIGQFAAASGISRSDEPGLSVVIPFVHEDLTPDAMLPHIIRNYFFPILTGRLRVEVGAHSLDKENFAELAKEHGGSEFADGRRVAFIKELHAASENCEPVKLDNSWLTLGIDKAVDDQTLAKLQSEFQEGKLISVRAPLLLRAQKGPIQETFVDLYLRASPDTARGEAFFVRGGITIPGEARRFQGRNCFGAMLAQDTACVSFLGDAENPAHTIWSGTAEKVRQNWKNPAERLREIRDALNKFYQVIARPQDTLDPDALINVFFVKKSGQSQRPPRRNPVVIKPPVPPLERPRRPYAVRQRKGGFVVRGSADATLPLEVRVRMAYDVVEGNPLRQYSPYDFDLTKGEIDVQPSGAQVLVAAPNELLVVAEVPDFSVVVTGFDENRDLFVSDRKL